MDTISAETDLQTLSINRGAIKRGAIVQVHCISLCGYGKKFMIVRNAGRTKHEISEGLQ